MTTPTKTTTAKVPAPAKKAATPAPAPEPAATKQPTRSDMLARLAELKYDGPTSYTATTIRDSLLPWVEAGCPADPTSPVPSGALAHVHPSAKPARAPYRSKGYLQAAQDLRQLIEAKELRDLKAITAHLDAILAEAKETPTA